MKTEIGFFIIAFIFIVVGTVLISPIASNAESTGQTSEINVIITGQAANVSTEVPGSGIVSSEPITVFCIGGVCGGGHLFNDNEFMLLGRQPPVTGGFVTNTFQLTDDGAPNFTTGNIELTYTAESDGFDPSVASRTILTLVILFSALAIGLIAIKQLKEK